MKHYIILLLFISCLLTPIALPAQISRQDLGDLERHRRPKQAVSVLQSLDEPQDSSSSTASLIGTWDFLDEEEKAAEMTSVTQESAGKATHLSEDVTTMKGRLSQLPQELILPYNEQLEIQIASYVMTHAGALRGILGKYAYWKNALGKAFLRHGLPEDLTALAIVESAMNPLALSKAGARGMWQFMPETARHYGLQCDYTVDERLDPYRSADAAARYLKAAYERFHDWPLAISSYNCGPGAVEKAILKAGTTDFWSVYPFLPSETRGYMPAFVAALYSVRFHALHDIKPKAYSEGTLSSFTITRPVTFAQIIRATGITKKELTRLNPQYTSGRIPGGKRTYILRLPRQYAKLYRDNIDIVDAD